MTAKSPRLNLLVLRSSDLEAARGFYEQLGLPFVLHQHRGGLPHYASEQPSFTLELYPLTEGQPPTTSVRLGFAVADLHILIARLRDSGANVLQSPMQSAWGYRAVVADPDGHRVELAQLDLGAGADVGP